MNSRYQLGNEDLEDRFDNNEDVLQYFGMDSAVVDDNPPLGKRAH
ncbi:hypothetical protein [Bifidobacterium cuniculi]|uniref:Uncharacterized protein n=1 Tax=Bifidobacterium cuniculi TaxID=1688 RepID=A0A087AWQ2_9BIFI|nr:hypothetical protein [Bifidobacterium cuniculi]KFI63202.1 hypothetical protein BCUN_1128 [Bifidobacterium cuniculi]